MANDLSGGLSVLFARALASFFTSLVMWRKCSLKFNMGLMWTPSILYDLFGGSYSMCVIICANLTELIFYCSVVWFFVVDGVNKPRERSSGFAFGGLELESGVLAE